MFKKLLIIFLLTTFYLLLAPPTYALKFGPHMVCNTNPESFTDVRSEYNQMNGWTGIDNKIPATIILQTNTPIEVISTALAAARDNGIIPYIRLAGPGFWDQIDETEALKFATNLNLAAGSSGLSGIYVAPGNEINRDDEWTGGDKIGSLAKALNTLLANAQNYKVAFPGLDLYYNGDSWRSFLTNFNNQNHELLKSLASSGAFVAHSYTEASNRNPNKWQEEQGFLNSIGVNAKFLFYEANLHPAINAGADEQARYIKEVAFPAYNSNSAIEIVTPFSRAKPADNTASSDNPYLMLVIKEDGSQAKFIEFPHPAENCGGGPNILLKEGLIAGDYIIHKKSVLTQILESMKIFVKGNTGSPEEIENVRSPDFSKVSQIMDKNNRLLPAFLQKKLARNTSGQITAEYGFPACNLEKDEQKKIEGKETAELSLKNRDVSNSLVLNDLLNSTSKKNEIIRKSNNPFNYVVEEQKPESDEALFTCEKFKASEPLNQASSRSNKEKTDWQGNLKEGEAVLAAATAPTVLTPTPVQRTAKFEIVNQPKTRTYLNEIADAISGSFGFLRALIPWQLAPPKDLNGMVKNEVKTKVEVPWNEETQKPVDFSYPEAGTMNKTADLFQKMLMPAALQK